MAPTSAPYRPIFPAVPLFAGLDKQERAKIARLGTPARIEPGKVLTRQGHTGREFLIIVGGFARCQIDGRVVARFGPGDFFGEVALLDGGPRTATVVAVTPMDVLVFTASEFTSLVLSSGEVAYRLLTQLATRLRTVNAA